MSLRGARLQSSKLAFACECPLYRQAERTFSLKPLTEQEKRALEARADQKTDQLGKLRYRRDWKVRCIHATARM